MTTNARTPERGRTEARGRIAAAAREIAERDVTPRTVRGPTPKATTRTNASAKAVTPTAVTPRATSPRAPSSRTAAPVRAVEVPPTPPVPPPPPPIVQQQPPAWQPQGPGLGDGQAGQGPPWTPAQPPRASGTTSSKADLALVLGILSIFLNFFYVPGILAMVWGGRERHESSKARTGFICGIVGTALSAVWTLIIVISLVSAGNAVNDALDTSAGPRSPGTGGSAESELFPGRSDVKENDKERNVGQSADLSGYTVTVTAAAFEQEVSQFESDGYLVADVKLLNRDDEAQSYNLFEWKLLTPGGQIIDPSFTTNESLGSGDLVQGGTISGQLTWEVGNQKGDYYLIYDPSDLGTDRGVWQVKL